MYYNIILHNFSASEINMKQKEWAKIVKYTKYECMSVLMIA